MNARLSRSITGILAALSVFATPLAASAGEPRIAIMDFGMHGLTSDWWGAFQPGVALSDLLTDKLTNKGGFTVLDRQNLDSVMQEHRLSQSGMVTPATAVVAGRFIGARYIIAGNILQFDRSGGSSASAGGLLGRFSGIAGGALNSERITLRAQVRVIDVQTGQIVQSITKEITKKNNQFSLSASNWSHGGSYSNGDFTNSTMGHLVDDEAQEIATDIDPSRFHSTGAQAGETRGVIIGIDEQDIVLNIGTRSRVNVGDYYNIMKTRSFHDPSTGRTLTSSSPVGTLQITSVNGDTSVGRVTSGTARVGLHVESAAQ
jgi:curli biogenesis system outer membrane secretion channel CsgG